MLIRVGRMVDSNMLAFHGATHGAVPFVTCIMLLRITRSTRVKQDAGNKFFIGAHLSALPSIHANAIAGEGYGSGTRNGVFQFFGFCIIEGTSTRCPLLCNS